MTRCAKCHNGPRKPGQRWCKACHAGYMRVWRVKQKMFSALQDILIPNVS